MADIDVANPGASEADLRAAFDELLGTGRTLPFFGSNWRNWTRPALASFPTWMNQNINGLDAVASDNTNGGPLSIVAPTTNSQYRATALFRNAPTPPWTIVCTISIQCNYLDAEFGWIPILCQSSDQKLGGIYWTNVSRVWFDTVNDSALDTVPNDNLDNGFSGFAINDYLAHFKLVHTGTGLEGYFSPNGIDWDQLGFDAEAALTFMGDIAKVGFGLDRGASGGNGFVTRIKLWNWVES